VWFATSCGAVFTLDTRTNAITTREPAPRPTGPFRQMRMTVTSAGDVFVARGTNMIERFRRDPTLPNTLFAVGGAVHDVVAAAPSGHIFFVDIQAHKLRKLDPATAMATDVAPLGGRPWLLVHPLGGQIIAVNEDAGSGHDVVVTRLDVTGGATASLTIPGAGTSDLERGHPSLDPIGGELYIPLPGGLAVVRDPGSFPTLFGWVGLGGGRWAGTAAAGKVWLAHDALTLVEPPQFFANGVSPAPSGARVVVTQASPLRCFDPVDADGDGMGNACDVCPNDPGNDGDGDGVCLAQDNCPTTYNPMQEASDNDGTGDACDTDDDNDGRLDPADNCRTVANGNQADKDKDRVGDACDNCLLVKNPDQRDSDRDGLGNMCESDDDNDGVADTADNCPEDWNDKQQDRDHDGIGDACEKERIVPGIGWLMQARLDALTRVFDERFTSRPFGPWGPWEPLTGCPKCSGEQLTAYNDALGRAPSFLSGGGGDSGASLFLTGDRIAAFLDLWDDTTLPQAISELNNLFGEDW
jgi:streptogramin lyase